MTHPGQQGLTDEGTPNGSWETMMCRVAKFHHKHDFANPVNNGHDMGYRLTLMLEELGELASAITKGKPKEEAALAISLPRTTSIAGETPLDRSSPASPSPSKSTLAVDPGAPSL